jgi:2-polyprenyl-3-methyl-5-hydroxy-6-metoxy-1,4-benzoquinol methylase
MDSCPICGSAEIGLKFNGFTNRNPADGKQWPVFECRSCQHGFMNPRPEPAVLNEYYSASYTAYRPKHGSDEQDDAAVVAKAKAANEFRHIRVPAGKRVLDLGCGGGFFLNICRQLGAEVQGIEPSPHGAEAARRQGIPVFEGTLDQFLEEHGDQRFDVITSNHVIEHVPDPIAALAGLKSLLAPGGTMTIAVPNARSMFANALGAEWHNTDLPFHLHHFSPDSLRIAAETAGLATVEISTTSLPSATAASLQLLLRRKYYVPQKLSRRLPLMGRYSERLAVRQDARREGEALLGRFS